MPRGDRGDINSPRTHRKRTEQTFDQKVKGLKRTRLEQRVAAFDAMAGNLIDYNTKMVGGDAYHRPGSQKRIR